MLFLEKVNPLPKAVLQEMNNDQKYLHEDDLPSNLEFLNYLLQPRKLHNARWLTLANRILRLYVSTTNPSEQLYSLVHFVINLYAPAWFQVK